MKDFKENKSWKSTVLFVGLFLCFSSCPFANFYKKYGAFGSPEKPDETLAPLQRVIERANKQLRDTINNLSKGIPPPTSGGGMLGMLAKFGGKTGVSPLAALWTIEKTTLTENTFDLMTRASYYDAFIKDIDKVSDFSTGIWEGTFGGGYESLNTNVFNCVQDFFSDLHLTEEQMKEELSNLHKSQEIAFVRNRMQEANKSAAKFEENIIEYVKLRTALSYNSPAKSSQMAAAFAVELLIDLVEQKKEGIQLTTNSFAEIWDNPKSKDAMLAKQVCDGVSVTTPSAKTALEKAREYFVNDNNGFASLLATSPTKSLSEINKKMEEFNKEITAAAGRGLGHQKAGYEYRLQRSLCEVAGLAIGENDQGALRAPTSQILKREKRPEKKQPKLSGENEIAQNHPSDKADLNSTGHTDLQPAPTSPQNTEPTSTLEGEDQPGETSQQPEAPTQSPPEPTPTQPETTPISTPTPTVTQTDPYTSTTTPPSSDVSLPDLSSTPLN